MEHDRRKLRSEFADKLDTPELQRQVYLTPAQEQDWQDMLKNIRENYISAFAHPLDGGEDDWSYWQKRYGPDILARHLERTESEIRNFLDFMGCDPHVSKRVGEIMRIHDCGKADPRFYTPEDWVCAERPDIELRKKRRMHTTHGQRLFDEILENHRSLPGETNGFRQLALTILGDHHNLLDNDPLTRAIAIVDAYDGDTHHHWPHQGDAPRDAMTEFRRLLGLDADQKYAGKVDTDLVLQYAGYKQHTGTDVDHNQLQRELRETRRSQKPSGPAAATASMNR
jgi:hypothetical protein